MKNVTPLKGLLACETCGLVQKLESDPGPKTVECVRCGTILQKHKPLSRARTMAFSLAALLMYLPANIYPILIMEKVGRRSTNTIWTGVVSLYQDGMWFVASIVFCASILIPLLKLLGLFFVALTRGPRWQRERTWTYKSISVLGPWAMLDVFLLAIAVALVKFGSLATVMPGTGLFAFACVVVLTMIASASFDPRLIWNEETL